MPDFFELNVAANIFQSPILNSTMVAKTWLPNKIYDETRKMTETNSSSANSVKRINIEKIYQKPKVTIKTAETDSLITNKMLQQTDAEFQPKNLTSQGHTNISQMRRNFDKVLNGMVCSANRAIIAEKDHDVDCDKSKDIVVALEKKT
jgi:hypothetical protein